MPPTSSTSTPRLVHVAGWALILIALGAWSYGLWRGAEEIGQQGYVWNPLSANALAELRAGAESAALGSMALLLAVVLPLRLWGARDRGARMLGRLWAILPALGLWAHFGLRYNRFEIPSLWRERVALGPLELPRALTDGSALLTNAGMSLGAIALALALAWLLVRVLPTFRLRPAPRWARGMAVATLMLLMGTVILPSTWGRRAPTGGDVVLISLDATRADRLGIYGGPEGLTPQLDRLAADAEVYDRAYCQEPWTLTSHMSMLTGLYPDVHGLDFGRSLSPRVWTLPERLRDAGWSTAGSVFDCFLLAPRFGYAAGFDRYEENGLRAGQRAAAAGEWMSEQSRAAFLFLHFYDPHSDTGVLPYEAEEPWLAKWAAGAEAGFGAWTGAGGASESLRRVNEEGLVLPDSLRESVSRLYDAGIAETDAAVGIFLDALRAAGRYDDAMIIVVADHGEALGDDGHYMHERLMDETLRIPMFVKWPGNDRAGQRRTDLVETVDLFPTVLAAMDLPPEQVSQGRDLGEGPTQRRFSLHRSGPEYAITTENGWRLRYRWDASSGLSPLGLRRAGDGPGDGSERPDSLAVVMDRWAGALGDVHRANQTLATGFAGGDVSMQQADEDLLRSLGYIE